MGNEILRIGSLIVQTGNAEGVRAPSTYSVKHSDVDVDSARSMSGYMQRNKVRGNVTTITLSWNRLSWEEVCRIISATNNPQFTVLYLDPASQGMSSGAFYRDANMEYSLISYYNDEAYWTTTLSLVEY